MLFKKIGLFAIIVISLVISVVFPLQAQDQIWTNSTPIVQDAGAGPGVELGMRFISTVAGTITAIRFYKAASNIGTHVGSLWSSTGTLLGSVQFAGETASGWQQMTLPTPVAILANNPYVVSYYAPLSHFASDQNYTWPVNSPPLQASGSVYVYGPGGVFPTQNYNSTNYWVDVIFVPNPALSCPPPPHSAVLAWQAPSGVTQFNVYQNGVKITSSPISATTYTVSGLTAGSVLTFSVTSILNGSESSPSVLPTLTVPSP